VAYELTGVAHEKIIFLPGMRKPGANKDVHHHSQGEKPFFAVSFAGDNPEIIGECLLRHLQTCREYKGFR
jgi:hypothetical protein